MWLRVRWLSYGLHPCAGKVTEGLDIVSGLRRVMGNRSRHARWVRFLGSLLYHPNLRRGHERGARGHQPAKQVTALGTSLDRVTRLQERSGRLLPSRRAKRLRFKSSRTVSLWLCSSIGRASACRAEGWDVGIPQQRQTLSQFRTRVDVKPSQEWSWSSSKDDDYERKSVQVGYEMN